MQVVNPNKTAGFIVEEHYAIAIEGGELAQRMLKTSSDLPTSVFVPLKTKGQITKSAKKTKLRLN
jgi:DUF1009 family protein